MEDGIQHCEERFLEIAVRHGLCRPHERVMSLEDTLRSHNQIPQMMLGHPVDYKAVAESLQKFMKVTTAF